MATYQRSARFSIRNRVRWILIDQNRGSKLAPGSTGIFLPGEIEHNNKTQRKQSGIPMTAVVMDEIEKLADETGVGGRLQDV